MLSVIIIAYNEGHWLQKTVDSFIKAKNSEKIEIVVVDNGSTDNSGAFLKKPSYQNLRYFKFPRLSLTQAKNLGGDKAAGDYLLFCDAHVLVSDYWGDILLEEMERLGVNSISPAVASLKEPERVGMGLTLKENFTPAWLPLRDKEVEVPLLPGGFLLIKKQTLKKLLGFEIGFRVWGFDDVEFSLRSWLFGERLIATPKVRVYHLFRSGQQYKGFNENVLYNLGRLACLHFNPPRIVKTINLINNFTFGKKIIKELSSAEIWKRRAVYERRKIFDDSWYFNKFSIDF